MADPRKPSGGFQEGGWYEGRQYIGGSFSQPGQIHPQSTQQGAGQQVSKEVISQTSPGNVAYIDEQRKKAITQQPQTKEDVAPYLANFQDSLFKTASAPETKIPTMEELKTELAPDIDRPDILNRTEEFENLRAKYGVTDLEKSLTDLKAQQDDLYASLREQKFTEEGKPVAMGVISGRISEEERQYNERADYIGRQVARVTDELNTKYNVINAYMNFMGLDYQDAVKAYDSEFQSNLQMYDIITGAKKEARSAYEYDQTAARANLQIYMNAVTSGNIDYGSLSTDQKLMVQKLEVQSGLPVGFMSSLKMDKDADILFTTSNEGVTQVGFRNADGSISVESYGTRVPGKQSDSDELKVATSDMARTLNELGGSDFLVSPEEWKEARSVWITAGYGAEVFDEEFAKQYVDYGHAQDYGFSKYN